MKWILSILLLISVTTFGQIGRGDDSTKYIRYQNQYGTRMPRSWWDSVAHMPYGDTAIFPKPCRPGAIMMHTDKVFYKWNGGGWEGMGGSTVVSALSNAGSGYRWVKTASGAIKTAENTNTVTWDSTSNTLKANADTSYIATLSDLKDTAAAIRASVGGGTPAGSTGYVQYNNSGSFGAEAAFNYNATTNTLTVDNSITDSVKFRKLINTAMVVDSLVAFGNSITQGVGASVADSCFASRLASYYSLFLRNKGVGGNTSLQISAINLAYLNAGHHAAVTFEAGLNDLINYGAGANVYRGIKNAYEAAMVNTYISSYTDASSCTLTGSWTTGINAVSSYGGKTTNAASTSTNEDSLTRNITGTGIGINIIGAIGNAASAVIYIDGVKVDSFNTGQQAPLAVQSMGKYYVNLTNTSHHLTVVKRGGSGSLIIDYVGALVAPSSMRPFVFIDIPHLDSTGYALGSATQAMVDVANDSLSSAFNRALSLGLKVYHAKVNDYYIARLDPGGLYTDHVHPNNIGHRQIFNSVVAGLQTPYGQPGIIQFTDANRLFVNDINGQGHRVAYLDDITAKPITLNGVINNFDDSTSGDSKVAGNFKLYGNFVRAASFDRGVSIRGDNTNGATKWIVWRVSETSGSMSRFGLGAYNDGVKNHTNVFTDGYSGDVVSLGKVDVADGTTYTPYFQVSDLKSEALGPFAVAGTTNLTGALKPNGANINGDNVFREINVHSPGLGIKHGMRMAGSSPYYTQIYGSWNGSTTGVQLGWMDTDGATFHSILSTYQNGLVNITSLTAQNDTATYKPIVVNSSGNIYKMVGWPGAGSSGITSVNGETGASQTITGGTGITATVTAANTTTIEVVPSSAVLLHPLTEFYTDANNTGTGETDLYSYTAPSGTLAVDGQKISFEFAGVLNDATATSNLQVYFAGTAVGGTGALSVSGTGTWTAKGLIIRSSSSTARAYVTFTVENASGKVFTSVSSVGSVDFTSSNIIKITGTAGGAGGGSNDITAKLGQIMFIPIPI